MKTYTKICKTTYGLEREIRCLKILGTLGLSPEYISSDKSLLTVTMTFIDGAHPDESIDLYESSEFNELYELAYKQGIRCMDIHHGNTIIDSSGKWWLIDFSDAEYV